MALSSALIYLMALSVPVWLVVEQVHAWRGARARRVALQPAAVTPVDPRNLSGNLGRTAA